MPNSPSTSQLNDAPPEKKHPYPEFLRSLQHRNFYLYTTGNIVSLVGTWIQMSALRWLTYGITDDPRLLGLMDFASQIPVLLLAMYSGVVAESVNRRRLILFTQSLALFQAAMLAALTLLPDGGRTSLLDYWHLLALAAFGGIVQAFDLPARQTFINDIIPKRDLTNALAINSLTFNAARIVGPLLAGLIMAIPESYGMPKENRTGAGLCFLINSITYFAVLAQYMRMKIPERPNVAHAKSRRTMKHGFRYLKRRPFLMALLAYTGTMAIFALPYLMLLTVYAKDVFHGSASTQGLLLGAVGIGALGGAFLMARRRRSKGLGRLISLLTLGFCASNILLALSSNQAFGVATMVIAGFFMVMTMISLQTLIQLLSADGYRGRIMGLFTMMNIGLMPFGSLLSGWLTKWLGVQATTILNALVCVAASATLALMLPKLRAHTMRTFEYHKLRDIEVAN